MAGGEHQGVRLMICACIEISDYDYSEHHVVDVGEDLENFRWLVDALEKRGLSMGEVFEVVRFIEGEASDPWQVVFSAGLPSKNEYGKPFDSPWLRSQSVDRLWWIHGGLTRTGYHADVLKQVDAELRDRSERA